MPKYKTVFSLRIRLALRGLGIEPVMETDNLYKPNMKCWVYEETAEFMAAFDQLMSEQGGGRND